MTRRKDYEVEKSRRIFIGGNGKRRPAAEMQAPTREQMQQTVKHPETARQKMSRRPQTVRQMMALHQMAHRMRQHPMIVLAEIRQVM